MAGQGTIVEIRQSENIDGPVLTPVIEFSTPDKRVIHFDGISTNPPPAVGQTVPILYRDSKPEDARVDSFVDRWLMPTLFAAAGLLAILFSTKSPNDWLKFRPADNEPVVS